MIAAFLPASHLPPPPKKTTKPQKKEKNQKLVAMGGELLHQRANQSDITIDYP